MKKYTFDEFKAYTITEHRSDGDFQIGTLHEVLRETKKGKKYWYTFVTFEWEFSPPTFEEYTKLSKTIIKTFNKWQDDLWWD